MYPLRSPCCRASASYHFLCSFILYPLSFQKHFNIYIYQKKSGFQILSFFCYERFKLWFGLQAF